MEDDRIRCKKDSQDLIIKKQEGISMRKTMRLLTFAIVLILAVTSCAVCAAEEAIADIVANGRNIIAVFVPLTGEQRQYGESISNGIKMRVAEYNEANGTNYIVEVYDDKGDSTEAANIANKIIANDKVLCAMGSYASSCVLAAAPIFQEEGQLFLSPGASHPDVPKVGDYIFTYGINIDLEMESTLRTIAERFDCPKLGMIYQATDHGVQTYEKTAAYYPTLGGELVAAETFVADSTTDFPGCVLQCVCDAYCHCIIDLCGFDSVHKLTGRHGWTIVSGAHCLLWSRSIYLCNPDEELWRAITGSLDSGTGIFRTSWTVARDSYASA